MKFNKDIHGYRVQVFTPRIGDTLPTSYIPATDEIVMLGADVTITLNGTAIEYIEGSVIGLGRSVNYTLSAATPVHKM